MICVWQEEENYDEKFWLSDCGEAFYFTEGGTPEDNKFAFCPFCGRVLNGKQIDLSNLESILKLGEKSHGTPGSRDQEE